MPSPAAWQAGTISHSTARASRLYCACMATGAESPRNSAVSTAFCSCQPVKFRAATVARPRGGRRGHRGARDTTAPLRDIDPALLDGKLVVDAMNYWPASDGVLKAFEDCGSRLAGGRQPGFNKAIYLSERQTADRNFALGYSMRESGVAASQGDSRLIAGSRRATLAITSSPAGEIPGS